MFEGFLILRRCFATFETRAASVLLQTAVAKREFEPRKLSKQFLLYERVKEKTKGDSTQTCKRGGEGEGEWGRVRRSEGGRNENITQLTKN